MPKNYCIMQIWAESGKSALPIVTIHKSYISATMASAAPDWSSMQAT